MEADEKFFAYNVSPCAKAGHRLRTRSGHCIQCSPAAIGFTKRDYSEGHVYIAASPIGRLFKVGTTADLDRRKSQLNDWRYGRQFDWQMVASVRTENAGRIEGNAHGRLARFAVAGDYIRGGRRQRCYELFRCDFSDARDAVQAALEGRAILSIVDEQRASRAFNFRSEAS
jgi:hypothetical protein